MQNNINLEESRIKIEGNWLSSEDLTQKIQEKMKTGDLKIAELAEALERLSLAIENSETLEVKLSLSKDEYNELKARGKGDDKECVRKAIMAYIGGNNQEPSSIEPSVPEVASQPVIDNGQMLKLFDGDNKITVIKCIKCKSPIEITAGTNPDEIRCPNCSALGRLKLQNENNNSPRYKDHFLG